MKKLFAIILTISILLTLSACSWIPNDGENLQNNPTPNNSSVVSDTQSATQSGTSITREKAIEIALNHAGLTEAEVYEPEAEYDRERGSDVWEVEFEQDNTDYSYEIDAQSGEIIRSEKDLF